MQQRLVAEIVGPAGAGKSTLARALHQRDRTIQTGLSVWGLPLSLLILCSFLSLPTFLGLYRSRRRFRWREMGLVVRLNALHKFLNRESSSDHKTLLLDEGAIFAIGKLHAFDRKSAEGRRLERWAQNVLDRWAETLDVVIWLDAPDSVLAQRIRCRRKPHRIKGWTDRETDEFLARYRRSYEQIISALSARRRLKVVRFSTERDSLEQIAETVLAGIKGEGESACRRLA